MHHLQFPDSSSFVIIMRFGPENVRHTGNGEEVEMIIQMGENDKMGDTLHHSITVYRSIHSLGSSSFRYIYTFFCNHETVQNRPFFISFSMALKTVLISTSSFEMEIFCSRCFLHSMGDYHLTAMGHSAHSWFEITVVSEISII